MNIAVRVALEVWLIAVNFVTFALYGIDKSRAKRRRRLIPEKTLLLLPLLGGSLGGLLGMYAFHHKTKHWYFRVGLPLMLLAQAALLVWLFTRQ